MKTIPMHLNVNGEDYHIMVKPNQVLLDVLRDDLELTGTKEGCGLGKCGACTVLLDKRPVHSCLVLALQADGCEITTIEGIGGKQLHPLQESFVEKGAIQCGFCTPGMITTAKALLDENPNPSEEDIKLAIAGNLCRCTGYHKIVDAIHSCTCESLKASKEGRDD
ncbi:MAG: (2Fe-2S)-binding protein [Proteobacteria bacterium]|nr:(2Fe-2S)-binding protein [Pseudomonadota bacterium]MBU1581987.1 (2Fe-2S)-binding protein [Pseudomonadota bacterium]MBU2454702.1 (2Fe-2S)-binding protein [Pseudomonadota bacterium]MBU2628952.1 (2Fe-2S)-binding protein [Pseudomonadota bacterium]